MTENHLRLAGLLAEELGDVRIREIDSGVVLDVPSGRMVHDWVTVAVEWTDDEWIISDGALTARLLGQDFGEIVELLVCAGAPFVAEGDQLVARAPRSAAVEPWLRSYIHHLSSAPLVWQVMSCIDAGRQRTRPSPVTLMAEHSRGLIVARSRGAQAGLVKVNATVRRADENVKAPLAIAATNRAPSFVSTFIDLKGTGQAAAHAKRSTSYLLDAVSDLVIPKYIVVKGEPEQVYGMELFYDQRQANVVPDDDQDQLVEDAVEVLDRLLPV